VSGWLYTTDALWGDETVEMLHRGFAWGLLGLIAMHVGGVTFTSLRRRENLVRAMLDGEKHAPRDDDVA
jgi:cytochrome b